MPISRRVVRVFLASPGDLQDERRMAKDVTDEFNGTYADFFGCQVDLIGWEDTTTQTGRPQDIINQELLTCDLFIGMIWQRWGTPPDTTGRYTSGFEEEFMTAQNSFKAHGRPDMKMFFKDMQAGVVEYPNEVIRRTMEFKEKLVEEKAILFESFTDSNEFRKKFGRAIGRFVVSIATDGDLLRRKRESTQGTEETTTANDMEVAGEDTASATDQSFLGAIAGKSLEQVDSASIARLRLQGAAIAKPGNDTSYLGVHDANILFSHRATIEFSKRECNAIADAGLYRFANLSSPIFHWIGLGGAPLHSFLAFGAVGGKTSAEKVGALRVLTALGLRLEVDDVLDQQRIVVALLKEREAEVRLAVLAYLETLGDQEDIAAVEAEVAKNSFDTIARAMRTLVVLTSRHRPTEASRVVLETSYEALDSKVLDEVFSRSGEMPSQLLRKGISHRSSSVRLRTLSALEDRGDLSSSDVDLLLNDTSAEVRFAAIEAAMREGRTYSLTEARTILVRPLAPVGIFAGTSGSDEAAYRSFLVNRYLEMSRTELASKAVVDDRIDLLALETLWRRHFGFYAKDIRAVAASRGTSMVTNSTQVSSSESNSGFSFFLDPADSGEAARKKIAKLGLDVLSQLGGASDAPEIRRNLDDHYAPATVPHIQFLGRFGNWSDVPRVVAAAAAIDNPVGGTTFLHIPGSAGATAAAESIVKLASGRLGSLIDVVPPRILAQVIRGATLSDVSKLLASEVTKLLRSNDEGVRNNTCLKMILALGKSAIASNLKKYEKASPKYYSVVCLLDAGVSLPTSGARKLAAKLLAE